MSSTGFNCRARMGWLPGAVFLAAIMLLSACGSTAGNNMAGDGGGGISGTGVRTVVTGSLTGFGSVVVGGIHYKASPDAAVRVEGKTVAAESDLQHGMVVVLTGTFDSNKGSGTYDSIQYRSDLKGPVQNVDPLAGTFLVLGQTVLVDTATVLEGLTEFSTLARGAAVEVSGFFDPAGTLHATRLSLEKSIAAPSDVVKIKGRVSSAATGTFAIGNQQISFNPGLTQFVNLDSADIGAGDGRLIEATGMLNGATIIASRIERLEPLAGTLEGERIDVKGFVQSGDVNSFVLNTPNGPVTVNGAQAIIKDGAAIQAGTPAEIVGNLSDGILFASQINKEEGSHNIKLEGDVATIDRIGGTLTMNGITVVLSSQTILKDSSSARIRNFSLTDIMQGNHLQIGGSLDTTSTPNRVLATRVERLDPTATTLIQGPVSQITPQMVVLGIVIITNSGTTYRHGGTDLGSIGAFNAQITLNSTIIKAKGPFSSPPPQLTAFELEIGQ